MRGHTQDTFQVQSCEHFCWFTCAVFLDETVAPFSDSRNQPYTSTPRSKTWLNLIKHLPYLTTSYATTSENGKRIIVDWAFVLWVRCEHVPRENGDSWDGRVQSHKRHGGD